MHISSIRTALASVFRIPLKPSTASYNVRAVTQPSPAIQQSHASFSTSRINPAPKAGKKGRKGKAIKTDKRITLIRYFLYHPTTLMPRPLRFSRNRSLRHWTIHRAWNLYRMNVKSARQLELERQYNAMREANEELRVAAGDGGKLFRRAQMKTGVWSIPERGGGIPIEYSRGMADWMGTKALMGEDAKIWNHAWKRS